jgi:hypothetical protein
MHVQARLQTNGTLGFREHFFGGREIAEQAYFFSIGDESLSAIAYSRCMKFVYTLHAFGEFFGGRLPRVEFKRVYDKFVSVESNAADVGFQTARHHVVFVIWNAYVYHGKVTRTTFWIISDQDLKRLVCVWKHDTGVVLVYAFDGAPELLRARNHFMRSGSHRA